jgi:hypothetical protein
MLDITKAGSSATGEVVIRSRDGDSHFWHLYLSGSVRGDEIHFDVDTDRVGYTFSIDFEVTFEEDGTLTGYFHHPVYDVTADFNCIELAQTDAAVDSFIDINAVVLGMAFDGDDTWLSTSGKDYFLLDSTALFVDTVEVFLGLGAHWTSDALTSDSTLLWGHYPVTVSGPGGARNESDVVEFDKNGEIQRTFRVGHRITGLAWSSTGLWSLSTQSDVLYRFDLQGAVLETVEIGIPDLVDVEFDGTDFWAIGWFMKRLYRINRSGDVLTVFHIPGEQGIIFPSGLAFDGKRFWYSFNTSYLDTRIYWFRAE